MWLLPRQISECFNFAVTPLGRVLWSQFGCTEGYRDMNIEGDHEQKEAISSRKKEKKGKRKQEKKQ